jgi:V8-like Glu-specific endopeptidase
MSIMIHGARMTLRLTTRRAAVRRRRALASALLGAVLLFALDAGAAHAQIRFLPASEYEPVNIRTPQSIVSNVNALSQQNVFERLANFRPDSRYRQAGRPVGRLKVHVRDAQGREGTALCTASIVSAEYLLTNHHCVPGDVGLTVLGAKVELAYLDGKNTSGVRSYVVSIEPVEASEALDYSILRVRGNPSADFGTVAFARQPAEVQEAVFIIGYPEGEPETLSRKDCYVRAVLTEQFIHTCDTLGGSSGSPVFSDNTFRMIGLHFAGAEDGNYAKNLRQILKTSRVLAPIAARAGGGADATGAAAAPAAPARPTLTVALASRPAGAAVFYEKTLLGVTPLDFALAPQGRYTLQLRKDGYANEALTLEGAAGRVERTVRLRPAPAPAATAAAGGTTSGTAAPAQPAAGHAFSALLSSGRFDPAAAQARKALAFWAELDKSAATGAAADKDPLPQPVVPAGQPAAAEQQRKADAMFKALGK